MNIKLLSLCICFSTFLTLQSQLPYVSTPTLIPQNPGSSSIIKVVTKVTTPNQSIIVDIPSFTLVGQQIKIRACYSQGLLPATQSYIDTLTIGQLPAGNYQIIQIAYLSSTQQHCTPIDSNSTVKSLNIPTLTGINENEASEKFSVSANSTAGSLFVNGISDEAETYVFSASGALIKKELLINRRLDIAYLTNGLYFIVVSDNGKYHAAKFLKSGTGQ